jgi:hypothetical protein
MMHQIFNERSFNIWQTRHDGVNRKAGAQRTTPREAGNRPFASICWRERRIKFPNGAISAQKSLHAAQIDGE